MSDLECSIRCLVLPPACARPVPVPEGAGEHPAAGTGVAGRGRFADRRAGCRAGPLPQHPGRHRSGTGAPSQTIVVRCLPIWPSLSTDMKSSFAGGRDRKSPSHLDLTSLFTLTAPTHNSVRYLHSAEGVDAAQAASRSAPGGNRPSRLEDHHAVGKAGRLGPDPGRRPPARSAPPLHTLGGDVLLVVARGHQPVEVGVRPGEGPVCGGELNE